MRRESSRVRFSLGNTLTPMVKLLMWINGLIYVFLFLVQGESLLLPLAQSPGLEVPYRHIAIHFLGLVPDAVIGHFAFWQPLTYLFVHVSFFHLLFNMLGLWWFGADVERLWGSRYFLRYYFFTGIGAAATSLFVSFVFSGETQVPTFGASGSIFGLLLAYGLLFPNRLIYLYFVIPVKAKYCVAGFFLVSFGYLITSAGGGVSHSAHLGGGVFGLLWFFFYGKGFSLTQSWHRFVRWRRRRRLRVVRDRGGDDDSFKPYSDKTIH